MFKSNGGFTLVELIVVIAILAILAGIGVPAYSSYIQKATDTKGDFVGAMNQHIVDANAAVTAGNLGDTVPTIPNNPNN